MNEQLFWMIVFTIIIALGQAPRIYISDGEYDVWRTFVLVILSLILSGIIYGTGDNMLYFGYLFLVVLNYTELPKAIKKFEYGSPKMTQKRMDNLKSLYQSTKNPVLLGNTYLRTRQAQTRQILTGALTYAQPKEYSLHINCTNISDKTVTAVEIEVKTLNAFNEEVSSFVVSTRKQLLFGNLTECSWDLSGSFDINNAITKVKRVMFSDDTTWNNN